MRFVFDFVVVVVIVVVVVVGMKVKGARTQREPEGERVVGRTWNTAQQGAARERISSEKPRD